MGADQSIRKLTVENDEDVDVIKVSHSIVQRLTQNASETNAAPVSKVRPNVPSQSQLNKAPPRLPQSSDAPDTSGYPVYYYPELTLTAIQIQQQKEQELLTQDQYWRNRMENLEKNHLKINRIIDEEYRKATEELYADGQKKEKIQDIAQPCLENTEKVLKCYQEHPKEILKCSNLVEEFSNCVDQRRARVIAARC